MIQINREELAWAAGFFDGEGCTNTHLSKIGPGGRKYCYLSIQINQIEPSTLERFRKAVGFGSINGPRLQKNPKHSPQWHFAISAFEEVQQTICMLWPFLSKPKKDQMLRALALHKESIEARNKMPLLRAIRPANCHTEKQHFALGFCKQCYNKRYHELRNLNEKA